MNTLFISRMSCIVIIFSALLFQACEKDPIPNESELITTVRFVLAPTEPLLDTVIFQFRDPDGDGGIAPVITNGQLISGARYSGQLYLLNESVSPAIRIDQEVSQEAENHQIFYTIKDSLDLQIQYQDQDANGNPLGLKVECLSGQAGQGRLTLTLRHEPDKNAEGVRDGRIQNAGGETDIEVHFDVIIK